MVPAGLTRDLGRALVLAVGWGLRPPTRSSPRAVSAPQGCPRRPQRVAGTFLDGEGWARRQRTWSCRAVFGPGLEESPLLCSAGQSTSQGQPRPEDAACVCGDGRPGGQPCLQTDHRSGRTELSLQRGISAPAVTARTPCGREAGWLPGSIVSLTG